MVPRWCRLRSGRALPVLLVSLLPAVAHPGPADADLLGSDEDRREIPFTIGDGKPMIAAEIAGVAGRMMFDIGTPDAVFLNRDAVPLDAGVFLAEGRAASGQTIEVRQHEAPPVAIGGRDYATGDAVRSGNFGFAEELLGPDFLGFVGAPAVEGEAFLLDYDRRLLTVLRTDAQGGLTVVPPSESDVLARIEVAPGEGDLPTTVAAIAGRQIAVDFDTGDGGTLYLRAGTIEDLRSANALATDRDRAHLAEVSLGGVAFPDLTVRLVEAGGPQDARSETDADLLRIGAGFLSIYPTLWLLPAGRIEILRPGASFLDDP